MSAQRFNQGKPKLSYIRLFHSAIEVFARVKEFGAAKYDDGNWRQGGKPDKEYLDSLDRHIDQFLKGEIYDEDSGCAHLGHALWNIAALIELNHPDEIIDKEVFFERIAYWEEQKRIKAKGETKKTESNPLDINTGRFA
jgi:hypothetical protein